MVGFLKSEGHELIEIKENWTEKFLITGMPIMQAHGMASNLEKTLRGVKFSSNKLQKFSYFFNKKKGIP